MKKWKCTVCGYIHKGDEPPEKCPVCGADRSLFVLLQEDSAETGSQSIASPLAQPVGNEQSRWRCSSCGYVHTGSSPPEECPVCGADQSQFVLLDETPAESAGEGKEPTSSVSGEQTLLEDESGISKMFPPKFKGIGQKLTQFHGHPIAVHIPNGVLPVSVLFAFLALLFGSGALAVAAKCNFILIALAMPLVIATGIIDWINKFKGRMTQVFKVKMICAGIVTVLTLILAIWWIAVPNIYTGGLASHWFFFMLHLVDLAAAAIAGWYGGKLVFNNG